MRSRAIVLLAPVAAVLAALVAACSLTIPFGDYDSEERDGGPAVAGMDATMSPAPDSGTSNDAGLHEVTDADAANVPRADGDAAAAPSPYAEMILADHPIVYVRLGDPEGSAGPVELLADGGTIKGTYYASVTCGAKGAIAGDPDTAVSLDGTNIAINLSTNLPDPNPNDDPFALSASSYTGEIWARLDPARIATFVYQRFWSRNELGASRQEYAAGNYGNQFFTERIVDDNIGGGSIYTSDGAQLDAAAPATWVYVAATYDFPSATLRLYIDGTLLTEEVTAGGVLGFEGPVGLLLGGEPEYDGGNASTLYTGVLDEFALYGNVLDAGTILHHYQVGTGTAAP